MWMRVKGALPLFLTKVNLALQSIAKSPIYSPPFPFRVGKPTSHQSPSSGKPPCTIYQVPFYHDIDKK